MKNKKRLKLADKVQRRIQSNGYSKQLVQKGREIDKLLNEKEAAYEQI